MLWKTLTKNCYPFATSKWVPTRRLDPKRYEIMNNVALACFRMLKNLYVMYRWTMILRPLAVLNTTIRPDCLNSSCRIDIEKHDNKRNDSKDISRRCPRFGAESWVYHGIESKYYLNKWTVITARS